MEALREKSFDEGERHHVVPKCIGGSDEPENIIKIGYREHYIAHYMLAKAYDDDRLWFAFNMMRRVCEGKSVLYEAARKYISRCVSKNNKGRKRDDEYCRAVSKRNKGTLPVRDANGRNFKVSVDDARFEYGELVHVRKGSRHSSDTIEQMKRNGLRGRRVYHNVDEWKTIYLRDGEDIPSGYVLGGGPVLSEKALNRKKVSRWITETATGKFRRIADTDIIPDGYVEGRKNCGKRDRNGRWTNSSGS